MQPTVRRTLSAVLAGIAVVAASFLIVSSVVYFLSPPAQRENRIHITEATYGENCRRFQPTAGRANLVRSGNATVAASQSCDNTDVLCPVVVDGAKLGDPAVGCDKDFAIAWRCGANPTVHHGALPPEARGHIVWLSCLAGD